MPKITDENRNYLKEKKKYILMYENRQSQFVEGFRKKVFNQKSFLSGDKHTDSLLYISLNYSRLISHRFADYEIGQGFEVIFKNKSDTDNIITWRDLFNIQRKLYLTIVGKSKTGYSVVRILNIDGVPKFQKIPIDHYYVNTNGLPVGSDWYDIKEHNIVSVSVEIINGQKERFTYIDSYIRKGDKWIGTYCKYKYDAKFEFKLVDLQEIIGSETMDHLPLFVFNNDIENEGSINIKKTENDPYNTGVYGQFFGESDYIDVMDILQDINDRQSQISVEFIKNLTSKMSLPQTFFDQINKNNMKDILKKKSGENMAEKTNDAVNNFDFIVHGPGESEAKYITKDGTMITHAFKQIDSHVRNISAFTTIPVFMLSLEEQSGNRHVGTDTTEMDGFLTKIEQKRQSYYSTLQRLFAYVLYILSNGKSYELPTIKFARFRDYNVAEKADTASVLNSNGLMSKKSLIKFVFSMDDKEAEEEIENINKDVVNDNAITKKNVGGFLSDL